MSKRWAKLYANSWIALLASVLLCITPAVGHSIENHNVVPSATGNESFVALLGDSWDEASDPPGINDVVLERLFTIIKGVHAQAVFFTGDLTLGLARVSQPKSMYRIKRFLHEYEINGTDWHDLGLAYRSEAYKQQLEAFKKIRESALGYSIPFFPLSGEHENMGPDSLSLFRSYFKLEQIKPSNLDNIAYTVAIGEAFFLVFSALESPPKNPTVQKNLLSWIDTQLQAARSKYSYLFVVGHEPAFSTTEAEGNYRGLDKDPAFRDAFWNILVQNHVLAYFASHENLYDRTYRKGVWQFISGGAGAPFRLQPFDRAFYHFLLLSIPKDKKSAPKIQVIDSQGFIKDTVQLTAPIELYDKRIASARISQKN